VLSYKTNNKEDSLTLRHTILLASY